MMVKILLSAIGMSLSALVATAAVAATSGPCSGDHTGIVCSAPGGDVSEDLAVLAGVGAPSVAESYAVNVAAIKAQAQWLYNSMVPYWSTEFIESGEWGIFQDLERVPVSFESGTVGVVDTFYASNFTTKFKDGVATIFATFQSSSFLIWTSPAGAYRNGSAAFLSNPVVVAQFNVAAVPGPEAGAGLGALALGGVALFIKRRRRTA